MATTTPASVDGGGTGVSVGTGTAIPGSGVPPRPRPSDTLTATVVAPRRSVREHLRLVWQYRELLGGLVRKELKVRYKNSALGFVWSMLNPAVSLAVYYLVFAVFLKSPIPYFAIFLLSGTLVWNLFTASVPAATASIVGNSPLIKKVYFPREVLPMATVGAALVHFFLQSMVLALALVVMRYDMAWGYVWLVIPAVLTLLLFTTALGILLSAINVYLRDTQHLIEIVLMVWFWLTPILYQYQLIADRLAPHGLEWIIRLNPITSVTLAMQRGIYGKVYGNPDPVTASHPQLLPDTSVWWYLGNLVIVAAFSVGLLLVAIKAFDRLEGNFAEEI